ncbi:MAG: MFS transporter [Alphaproteobacteria bacterium]
MRVPASRHGWGRDGAVVGLVGAGHFFRHFYMLVLPPLFPILKAEFGVSYTALGGILTAYSIASGGTQYPMGVLVDRLGARGPLIGGLVLMSVAFGLMSFTESFVAILALAFCGGLGNSVFHPANYTILGAAIGPTRLGRAFAIHSFSGQMGWVAAPPLVIFLTALWGWRAAIGLVALLGLATALLLFKERRRLVGGGAARRDRDIRETAAAPVPASVRGASGLSLLLTPAILLMFVFFATAAGVQVGIQSFTPAALGELFGTPLVTANGALTGFLAGGAGGILIGGLVADRVRRLDLVALVGFGTAAAAMCLTALVALPVPVLIAVFAFAGLMIGMVAPSRDLLVRNIAPPGTSGRVFGFVSTGLDVGGGLSPLLFGWILDQGWTAAMFFTAAALMMVSIASSIAASRVRRPPAAAPTAAAAVAK